MHNRRSKSSNFLVFHSSGGISSRPSDFVPLIFVSTMLNSSFVNCPSLISTWLLIYIYTQDLALNIP